MLAALIAGTIPKNKPVIIENAKDIPMDCTDTNVGHSEYLFRRNAVINPANIPAARHLMPGQKKVFWRQAPSSPLNSCLSVLLRLS